jgi:hypothetical protein
MHKLRVQDLLSSDLSAVMISLQYSPYLPLFSFLYVDSGWQWYKQSIDTRNLIQVLRNYVSTIFG